MQAVSDVLAFFSFSRAGIAQKFILGALVARVAQASLTTAAFSTTVCSRSWSAVREL
jgi:hypothetical protein